MTRGRGNSNLGGKRSTLAGKCIASAEECWKGMLDGHSTVVGAEDQGLAICRWAATAAAASKVLRAGLANGSANRTPGAGASA